jgi:ABC-2 type transport system permease protein
MAIWVVLGMYFASTIAELTEQLNFLKYFTPFKYADSADIILNGAINSIYLAILLVANLIAVLLSYAGYNRKNIIV